MISNEELQDLAIKIGQLLTQRQRKVFLPQNLVQEVGLVRNLQAYQVVQNGMVLALLPILTRQS